MLFNALTGRCMWKHEFERCVFGGRRDRGGRERGGVEEGSGNGWTWGMQSDGRQRERERDLDGRGWIRCCFVGA